MNPDPAEGSARVSRWRSTLLLIAGVMLLVALVWLADPAKVAAILSDAEPVWVAATIAAIVAATVVGAFNAWLVAARDAALRFSSFVAAYWGAWALGQVVPGQVGDLVGLSLFMRRRGIALPAAVGRLGVDKLVSLFCTLALATGLAAIYDAPPARLAGLLAGAGAIVLLGAFFASRALLTTATGWRGHLAAVLAEAHRVIARRPWIVAANASLTMVKLSLIGLSYWTMLRALHAAPGDFVEVAITANSAGLIAYVPLSANGVGTVEAGGLYLFGLRGIAAPIVVAAYLALRAANLILAWGGTALLLLAQSARGRTGT